MAWVVSNSLRKQVAARVMRFNCSAELLAAQEKIYAEEASWRRAEAAIALGRWSHMRLGHSISVAHGLAVRDAAAAAEVTA